jgi:hypothetical protein
VPVVDDLWRIALLLSRTASETGIARAVATRLQALKARFATSCSTAVRPRMRGFCVLVDEGWA